MAHPLKKSERKRQEPQFGEPKLVTPENAPEITITQEFQGESVADTLIRARQQYGQDLRSIAEVLCIRYSYLDAIERGQYENLPGPTYAVGFVRTYAEFLGLDGDQVVERFKNEVEGLDSQTKLHFPTPAPEGKMPGGAVFLVAAVLFAAAYGVWFYLSNNGEKLGDLVAPVPERLQALVDGNTSGASAGNGATVAVPQTTGTPAQTPSQAAPQTAKTPAPAAPKPSTAPQVAAAPAETAPAAAATPAPAAPAPSSTADSSPAPSATTRQSTEVAAVPPSDSAQPEPAPAADATPDESADDVPPAPSQPEVEINPQAALDTPEEPAPAPAQSDPYAIPAAPDSSSPATAFLENHEPKVYGAENSDARIVLKATQDAWVQVRDRQGTLLLTRVLRVGDTYRVPNQEDLTLLTGNAGGLEITVDGQALAPLGPVGAVRRNIPLDPQALENGAGRQP